MALPPHARRRGDGSRIGWGMPLLPYFTSFVNSPAFMATSISGLPICCLGTKEVIVGVLNLEMLGLA